MNHRILSTQVAAALAAVLATGLGTLTVAAVSGTLGLRRVAPFAGTAGIGFGAAVLGAAQLVDHARGVRRFVLAAITAAASACTAVAAVGTHNLAVMSVGIKASCRFGLGSCVSTGVAPMPLLVRAGGVQRAPVVRMILWGTDPQQSRIAETEEARVALLGQPLLRDSYGVGPAVDGGSWTMPGSPHLWLTQRHETQISPRDLEKVILLARRATGWTDTSNTQWWIVTSLSSTQMGIRKPGCADHLSVSGIRGAVLRLPVGSCHLPASAVRPATANPCSPVAVLRPESDQRLSSSAATDLFIVHEFAEAATDPRNGWRVLVQPVCHNYLTLEIADVCARDGSMISAPAFYTRAGWQPSLLDPPEGGHPARCVDPANPGGRVAQSISDRRP